jgi:hypothetical protein
MHTVDTLLFLPIESQLFIFSPIIWSTERNVDIEPLELAADLSGLVSQYSPILSCPSFYFFTPKSWVIIRRGKRIGLF